MKTLYTVLADTNLRLVANTDAGAQVWPSGFAALDEALGGGFRSGELTLMGSRPGLGQTTFALQAARNLVMSGHMVVYFSFEHDNHSLLERLLVMEAGEIAGPGALQLVALRKAFNVSQGPDRIMVGRLAGTQGGEQAARALQAYSQRLYLHRSSGAVTNVEAMRRAVELIRDHTGQTPFVIVDYLQKVHAAVPAPDSRRPPHLSESERITEVVEGLKDLALDLPAPVLALVAVDKSGLATAKRTRTQDMRGSSALAHEADVVIILNNKFDVVARHHLMYNTVNVMQFHHWLVMSIEKNRNGVDNVDLEFRKHFSHFRFDCEGRRVEEELIDGRVFLE